MGAIFLKQEKRYEAANRETARYRKKYDLMYQWMKLKQNGIDLLSFFRERQINSIALYGMGDLSRLICNELSHSGIIQYGIDRQVQGMQEGIPVYSLENVPQNVEAILITPVLITDEIEDDIYDVLGEQMTFVFEEVLFELSRKYGVASELWPI